MALAVGTRAPAFELPAEPGGSASLASLTADGPALLAFYKPNCPVCQMSFPVFGEMARRYGGSLPVVAVAQEPLADARTWLDWKGFDGLALSDAPDWNVSRAFDIESVPTLVLVDGDGVIADVIGAWDKERVNALAARLGELTGGDTAPVTTDNDGLPSYKPG
ncbi:MAG TPA: TlpA disulfide reductase family protein [Acidimicrobiales bacterium]|nr:TlpA disulfide reductase family protein [Acidimicrobiales bacterium]